MNKDKKDLNLRKEWIEQYSAMSSITTLPDRREAIYENPILGSNKKGLVYLDSKKVVF